MKKGSRRQKGLARGKKKQKEKSSKKKKILEDNITKKYQPKKKIKLVSNAPIGKSINGKGGYLF